MVRKIDAPIKISSPRIFLVRMLVFLTLFALIAVVLYRQIWASFLNNPGLNGIILGALLIGILLAIRQVLRLFPEVRWVNNFRVGDPGLAVARPPVLLAPMAALLRDRTGRMTISQTTMRGILDSIGTRLDESRDIARYLTGLLVFLGLLGTFWGLLETVASIGKVIQSLEVYSETATTIENLKNGLAAPLAGMGISFSSSLFGLAGSLVLGFLDLQAGQAQNRFYTDLEDWLSTTVRDLGVESVDGKIAAGPSTKMLAEFTAAVERLEQSIDKNGSQEAHKATVQLADHLKALVQHMRTEQQMVRDWVEDQGEQQTEIRKLLERLSRSPAAAAEKRR
jgi:biopolymer transport protein ExbB/TolQ